MWQIVDRETGHEKGEEASQGAQTSKWSQRLDAQSNKTNRNYIKTPVFYKIEISKITDFQVKFLEGLRADHSDIFDEINNTGNFSDESDKKIEEYLEKFTANFS